MRLQIGMAAALVIDLLGPLPGVVGQPQVKVKAVKDKGWADALPPAGEKRTVAAPATDRADPPVRTQKLKDDSTAARLPDRAAAQSTGWLAGKGWDRPGTADGDR